MDTSRRIWLGVDARLYRRSSAFLVSAMLFFLLLAPAGCSSPFGEQFPILRSWKERLFAELYPSADVNQSLRLSLFSETEKEYRLGEMVDLYVENRSDFAIGFPVDFALRVFTYSKESQSWIELENPVQYSGEDEIVLIPNGIDDTAGTAFSVKARSEEPLDVRVVIQGYQIAEEGEAQDPIVAFLDIRLLPND